MLEAVNNSRVLIENVFDLEVIKNGTFLSTLTTNMCDQEHTQRDVKPDIFDIQCLSRSNVLLLVSTASTASTAVLWQQLSQDWTRHEWWSLCSCLILAPLNSLPSKPLKQRCKFIIIRHTSILVQYRDCYDPAMYKC